MKVEIDETIQLIMDEFLARLEEKNSWGKNEVKELYKDTVLYILLK